jgi:hypothetical protein
MSRNWEEVFSNWAKPPGETEEERSENAIRAIRNAVTKSEKLKNRGVKVFVHGSYRNNVNVRQESDVDVGVMCHDCFLSQYPAGKTNADYGNVDADYSFRQFKDELEAALVDHFGRRAVVRGNKAFDIHENTYHVEADVAPLFEFRQYFENGSYRYGVALVPDNGGRIENYPERPLESWPRINQQYENGVEKNNATSRAFKAVVRILKTLRNEMEEGGIAVAKPVPGFLIECMTWNAPNSCFAHSTWDAVLQAVLVHLWSNTKDNATCKDWCEVNGIKYLFHSSQRWTRAQAHAFVDAAWSYVGVR